MMLFKQTYQGCSLPIAIIVNKSMETGQVPDAMKLAKVIPIFKAITAQYHCYPINQNSGESST